MIRGSVPAVSLKRDFADVQILLRLSDPRFSAAASLKEHAGATAERRTIGDPRFNAVTHPAAKDRAAVCDQAASPPAFGNQSGGDFPPAAFSMYLFVTHCQKRAQDDQDRRPQSWPLAFTSTACERLDWLVGILRATSSIKHFDHQRRQRS